MFAGPRHPRQGPPQVAPPGRRAGARARPGRGPGGRHGQLGATTTRCGRRSSSRCRPSASWSATASSASSPSATTCRTTSSAPTSRASSCAPAPASTPGSPATRSSRTACRVELESSDGHNDTMLDPEQRIWGFETNFGGLAEIALVKSNQLMPKPDHLSWEEAAAPGLVNSTAYRQLVSRNGAGMKQGDNVLIWGASGGLGSYATQFALAGGANPICVVSSDAEGGDLPGDGRRGDHRPQRRGLQVLEGRAHPGPARVEALRQAHPRADRRRGRGHRLRAPGPRDLRRLASTSPARAARSSPAPRPPATTTSTTTATCGCR